jgi:hypothetical protein
LVIEFRAEVSVPLSPNGKATIRHGGINFIRPISGADGLADIGRSGEGMGQGAGIDKDNSMPAFF